MRKNFFISSAKFFALICVLTLSVGNAWAATYYYGTGRVVAVRFGGTDENFGKVGIKVATSAGGTTYSGTYATDTTPSPNNLPKYNTSGNFFISCYAQVNEQSGYTFEGWYSDETCETLAPDCEVINSDSKGVYYAYKAPRNTIPQGSNTSPGTAAVMYTLYAKFVKGSTTNKFKSQLTVQTESTAKGVVDASKTGVDSWGMEMFDEESLHSLTRGKNTITITGDQEETEEASISQRYYVYALPLRGYQFDHWAPGSGVTLAETGDEYMTYDANLYSSAYDVAVSTENTKDNGVYSYTGTLTANFTAIDADVSFTIQKDADKGSVTVKYANWEYDDGVARKKSYDLATMSSSETEKTYSDLYSTDEITLTAVPATGYVFGGWYYWDEWTNDWVLGSDDESYTTNVYGEMIFVPRFNFDKSKLNLTGNDKFLVGMSACQTFEQALAAATNSDQKTILQLQDYTIPRGDYTIPAGVKLLVPYDADQVRTSVNPDVNSEYKTITGAYRTLTLAAGATLNVLGEIEVSGKQLSNGQGATGSGCPTGPTYGQLIMEEGSQIILGSGAELRAWGFITGAGKIDVRRGARVDEMFQLFDFKGGSLTYAMLNNVGNVFPVNQYYIQNIEVPTKYHPGAALYGAMAAVNTGVSVKIIGVETDGATLFKMANEDDSEDTWVCKSYDASSDQQVYEVNNKAALSNLELNFGGMAGSFNSSAYTLPITNNMKIHLLSGEMDVTQSTVLLPGAEIEVDKLSTVKVLAGKNLYLYDTDEWTACVYSNAYASKIKYRPDGLEYNRNISSAAALGDAKINIHGTLLVKGALYTTESGANIYSSNADAGTIVIEKTAPSADSTLSHPTVYNYVGGLDSEVEYGTKVIIPAKLKNETGAEYRETAGTTAGTTYCYIQGAWHDLEQEDECFVKDGSTYFAKPKDYVELKSGEEDEKHLYYSTDETRTFIHTTDKDGNCQWWEVEPVEGGLMHCLHPNNDVYYFYDEDSESDTYETWQEKRFNVTFKNWDGTKLTFINKESQIQDHYELRYGSMPQWYGSNPTRETDPGYYTYDFIGWYPVLSPVVADAEYTAQYEKKPVLYAITFNDADGNLIEVTYCRRDEMPVCQRHTLADGEHWEPALGLVTGAQAYQLSTTTKTDNFTIKFVNWNGDVLHTAENVPNTTDAAGVAALYTGTPEKAGLGSEEEYTFAGWTPEITAATADAVYTATFTVKTIAPLTIINQQTIADEREVSELIVTTSGTLNVTGSVTATNFILESNGNTASGQLLGAEKLTATNAYFDLKLNAQNHNWYAVAVPWQVNAENGISVNGRTLTLGKDFDIIYYDGARRAAEGKQKCWRYVEDDGDRTLYPGRLYMIGLMGDAATIRFAKKAGANLLTTTTSVTAYASANAGDANWNGVANPALFHAFVNPGATAGQIYNSANKSYEPFLLNEKKLVVGQGVYVQAPNTINPLTVSYGGAYAAPRRERAEANTLFDVRIAPAGASRTDRLFVIIDEDKEEDVYVIGKDLAKVGVSKKVAQMWVARYNNELCMNTIAPVNGVAEYPLGISVPANGEYTISNVQSPMSDEAYTLYLTLNGEAIWDLSDAPYTLNLTKGTTNTYGLRISAKAPQVVTGVDEAVVDAKGETRKVLINNQVFIIRGNEVYTIDGQLVK